MKRKVSPSAYRVSKSRSGLGLFAVEPIEKGEFIIEYTGPRITNDEVEARRHTRYLFTVNSRWTIDGSPRSNVARYINHSCRPNAEAQQHRGKIWIVARKRIKPGEEIAYNYGKDYFDTFIGTEKCRCSKCASGRLVLG
jgi:SET domain-containing protein